MARPFVDRIEGSLAVLLVDGEERPVPVASLPPGVRAGVYLSEDLSRVDEAATAAEEADLEARRARLKKDDDGGDFAL